MEGLRVGTGGESCAWADVVKDQAEDILDDGLRVRIRRIDDAHAAFFASWQIKVVQSDAGPADHFDVWRLIQQRIVDLGIRPHDQRVGIGELVVQAGLIMLMPDDLALLCEPVSTLLVQRFGDNDLRHGSDATATVAAA